MIKVHYFIWVVMCAIAFCIGVYIPAQRDFIKSQTESEMVSRMPIHLLTEISVRDL